ncbi:MAG: hypothetical protein MJ170_04455 [Alphaproteobacteria bacterium]|nr:hypothetical protein [Alphaproteobacteria bacterium]
MKRIFLILCLMMICTASYADIASTGYVDSVVDSLPAVAKTGSYNDLSNKPIIPTVPTTISSFTNDSGYITNSYHDSTKQDKLPTGPSGGRYNLVWNGNTGNFVFELVPHSQCPSGTYDIGFSQCIDPTIAGTEYTYNAADMTWKIVFPYGNVSGVAVCNDTSGSWGGSTTTEQLETGGVMCWCKMTHPAVSLWVFNRADSSSSVCADDCAFHCGANVSNFSDFRSGVFSSVGQ